jgi:hypothetical protein
MSNLEFNNDIYKNKYIKYKNKYLELQDQVGGVFNPNDSYVLFYNKSEFTQIGEMYEKYKKDISELPPKHNVLYKLPAVLTSPNFYFYKLGDNKIHNYFSPKFSFDKVSATVDKATGKSPRETIKNKINKSLTEYKQFSVIKITDKNNVISDIKCDNIALRISRIKALINKFKNNNYRVDHYETLINHSKEYNKNATGFALEINEYKDNDTTNFPGVTDQIVVKNLAINNNNITFKIVSILQPISVENKEDKPANNNKPEGGEGEGAGASTSGEAAGEGASASNE